jgi:hypothetical protein
MNNIILGFVYIALIAESYKQYNANAETNTELANAYEDLAWALSFDSINNKIGVLPLPILRELVPQLS